LSRPSLLFGVLLLAAARLATAAPESPEEQARRLLEEGREYREQGKLKQALDNFNIIINSFGKTEAVGQALLEIGRYRMEVDGDAASARAAFEQVARDHPQSDAAPGAYYYLGRLVFQRATTAAELEDALAQFSRVETLYPGSEWVPRALQAAAMVHRRAGRYEEALGLDRRVALEYPASDAAPRAQFETGQALALMRQPRQAMEEFQQVRNRFPDDPLAAKALERITALYRLFGGAKPVFTRDASFSAGSGNLLKDVRALLVDGDGALWIASNKTKSAARIGSSGTVEASLTAEDPRTLSLTPGGEVVVAARTAVRVGPRDIRRFSLPPEKPGDKAEPLERILAAAVTPGGLVLVSDEKNDKVYRFDGKGVFQGTFPPRDTTDRKVVRIVVDTEGAILLLDRDEKTVRVYDETGRLLRSIGPAGLRKPADVAVDAFRNVYVADEEGGVSVFDPEGRPFFTLGADLGKPTALALDRTGAVLVYDDRADAVVRYR
jgi:TolA-binding protein/streptogramin lyase